MINQLDLVDIERTHRVFKWPQNIEQKKAYAES